MRVGLGIGIGMMHGAPWVPDAPTLTAPAEAADVYDGVGVTVSATVTAGQVPDRIDWVLDGTTVVATDSASPYSQTWTPSGVSAGAHTLRARFVYGSGYVDSADTNIVLFDPTVDADLGAWYDPNDTANMTKDTPTGQVSSWAPRAGSLAWTVTQTPGTACPLWTATGGPGNGAVLAYSAASSTYLLKGTGAGNQPKTVLFTAKAAAFAGESWVDAGSGVNARRVYISPAINGYAGAGIVGPNARTNTWNAIASVFNGATSLVARTNTTDGYAEVTGNIGANAANGIVLGAHGSLGGNCTGSMGHVVVINRALSTADIQRFFTWLGVAP